MKNEDIQDIIFRNAVEAIDNGNIHFLKTLINENPRLLSERLITDNHGYFKEPYLIYFVADNPIRVDKLPKNIVEITRLLIDALKNKKITNLQEQLNYTLALVVSGRIPKECGLQIALMDALIDEGAVPDNGLGAIAHENLEAAAHLVKRGARLILPVAVGLCMTEDINRLAVSASDDEKLTALAVAAFYGNTEMISFLLSLHINPNNYLPNNGFHNHATALHQAVYSGSLDAVKLLIEAGASPAMKDKAFDGTALDWAKYMQTEDGQTQMKISQYKAIEAWLEKLQ